LMRSGARSGSQPLTSSTSQLLNNASPASDLNCLARAWPVLLKGQVQTLPTQNTVQSPEAVSANVGPLDPPDRGPFRKNALLAGINDEIYAQIADKIDIIRCNPNEIIFEENDSGESLYLISQGSVKISKKGRAGQQETLAYLMERDFFGEMALVDRGKRSAQAAAVDHVVVGRIDRQGWDLLLHLAPHQVLTSFTRSVTGRLRHNNQHFIEEVMRNERLSLIGSTISSIVHDMNNPISCILCACEVIRTNNPDALIDEAAELIRDAVRKMETMTRELIDFSRGHTQLNLESLSVSELIHAIKVDFAKYRSYVDLRVEALYQGAIQVDRHRLLRVFSNLIRNACEAMAKADEKILLFGVKRTDIHLRFEISDTGCGIPAQLLPRIFEPFVTHGKSNGTGLGLAISKAVVEAHQGSISVKSSDRGTTFTIDLPLEA
jgi:signal transduction histidine kinase